MSLRGIDVSNNNGAVNWAKVSGDGIKFAWCKATEGTWFDDDYLAGNLQGARAYGVAVGAYHYARPDRCSPEAEADFFLSRYKPVAGDLLPVLDFETHASLSPAAMTAWANRFMERVKEKSGVECVLYTYPYFLRDSMSAAGLKGVKLWYADYSGVGGKYKYLSFTAGLNVVAQQYSSSGSVSGVSGRVDLNYAPTLGPILQTPVRGPRKPTGGVLPGPRKKPKWFWEALKVYLANRQKKAR